MIAAMDEAGVDKSAIVQASTCYGHDNSYVAESIAKHKNRLTGVCSIDIRAPDAVEKLKFWRERGMTGLRLFTGGSTHAIDASWIDDPSTFPAWDYAAQTGMSVCLQMSSEGFPKVLGILKQFPRSSCCWTIWRGRRSRMGHPMRPPSRSSRWPPTATFI